MLDEEKELQEETEPMEEQEIDSASPPGEEPPMDSQENEEEDSGEKKEKKEKKGKKDPAQEEILELKDRLMRNLAEFDNYRKRTEKEKGQMFQVGAKSIIERILPIIDNFQRGLDALSEEERQAPFAAGMDMIYRQLMDGLKEAGVEPIEAVGQEFDPNLHNAVMHEEDPEQGTNLVVEELQKGYRYRDTVVRHSMVKVVN